MDTTTALNRRPDSVHWFPPGVRVPAAPERPCQPQRRPLEQFRRFLPVTAVVNRQDCLLSLSLARVPSFPCLGFGAAAAADTPPRQFLRFSCGRLCCPWWRAGTRIAKVLSLAQAAEMSTAVEENGNVHSVNGSLSNGRQ